MALIEDEVEKTMIVETNNNTISIKRINFKEEDVEAITQQLINQSQQISPMLNATAVIDTGYSNHMCEDKKAFSNFDESFCNTVKFGKNSTVSVMGKGGVGQLQGKGYENFIKDGVCQIQDAKLGLIAQVNMTANRMFSLYLYNTTHSCFSAKLRDMAWLWHFRYGYLNFNGLKTLQQKNMGKDDSEMDRVRLLISYNRRWEENSSSGFQYISFEMKRVKVRKDLTYEQLLVIMYTATKVDPNKCDSYIKALATGKGVSYRTIVNDDDDIDFMLHEDHHLLPHICVISIKRRVDEANV
ncbi:hypothetical protein JRO89_XS09G0121600 [Xanthoceras sorbifolium]|uniref:Uncharacterized protein n=1 Tax=Xanthoceras sorbifolium TaxID=99658 RepID=A0ABQ8HL43_9ROSI|nr:hypothetical protein JRO89_XS09G0121600 [Xanthoceras sorbifolium]